VSKRRPARTTLQDIARVVGVNVSTVSRALNRDSAHPVSGALSQKIRRASERLKYLPNAAASSLRTLRTRTVGVIVPDITDPAYPPIIRGIEDGLSDHGYVAILANTDGGERRQQRIIETMRARAVDGLILATVARDEALRQIEGMPVVTVVRAGDDPRLSSVVHDEADGIRRILNHLVSCGHRQVAAIAGPQSLSTGFRRYRAFETHCKLLGIGKAKPNAAFAIAFNETDGERCAEELLARGQPFTAIVCANDRLAVGAIAALRRHGLRCPDDISVTGYNDMPLADRLSPALTTVRVQHYQGGRESAELIVELMRGPRAEPKHIVLPVEIVIRGSTRRVRALAEAGLLS
jgi:LacI family transcriptional regulator, galactose operon repressor